MSAVATIVFPVFSLILLGFLASRAHIVVAGTGKALTDFTFNLAVPALMFRTMATARFPDVDPLGVWASYFLTAGLVWIAATLATRLVLARPAADAPEIAMSSVFGNVVMLGIPLSISTWGPAAGATIALLITLHTPLLWTTATLHRAAVRTEARETAEASLARAILADLLRNPVILAIAAGTAWRLGGLAIPAMVDRVLVLLGQASVATALVSLGLGLGGATVAGRIGSIALILVLKTVAMPLTAWLLATRVFAVAPLSAGVIVMFAAMPTGALAFIFASRSGRSVDQTASAVALGTVVAAVSASVIVTLMGAAPG